MNTFNFIHNIYHNNDSFLKIKSSSSHYEIKTLISAVYFGNHGSNPQALYGTRNWIGLATNWMLFKYGCFYTKTIILGTWINFHSWHTSSKNQLWLFFQCYTKKNSILFYWINFSKTYFYLLKIRMHRTLVFMKFADRRLNL